MVGSLIVLLVLFSFYRLWTVWANKLNFDGVRGGIKHALGYDCNLHQVCYLGSNFAGSPEQPPGMGPAPQLGVEQGLEEKDVQGAGGGGGGGGGR